MRPPPCRLAPEAEAAGKIPPVRPRSPVFPASHPPLPGQASRARGGCEGRGQSGQRDGAQLPAVIRLPAMRRASEAEEAVGRSEEHTSELQSLMRISYAVFCLKKKKK